MPRLSYVEVSLNSETITSARTNVCQCLSSAFSESMKARPQESGQIGIRPIFIKHPKVLRCLGNCLADRIGRNACIPGSVDAFYVVLVGQPGQDRGIRVCCCGIDRRIQQLIRRAAI